MTHAPTIETRSTGPTPRVWLWSTVLLSGGACAAAVALAPPASGPPARSLAWLLFLGSSVHVASTGWLFTLSEVRVHTGHHRWRYRRIPIALVIIGAVVAAAVPPAELAGPLLCYFAWQFFHFQKQNLGMAALAASSHHLPPLRPVERRALVATGVAGIVALAARPALLQLGIALGTGGLFGLARLGFGAAVVVGLLALWRRPRRARPIGFVAVYAMALLFSLPIFVFGSPYAAVGGMTIAHGLQYLFLVGLIAGGGRGMPRARRMALLGNVALLGGAVLSGMSHLHGTSPATRLLFGAYLGAVMAHFVIDAGLWRLRDPFPRMFLAHRLPSLVSPGPPGVSAAPRSPLWADLR